MVLIVTTIVGWLLTLLAVAVIFAQREQLTKKRREVGDSLGREDELNYEVSQLQASVERERRARSDIESAYQKAVDRALEYASRPPVIVEPPDVVSIVRELGESIGTAIYGKQQQVVADLTKQVRDTSMVEEKINGEWFPDVEFDNTMGPMPTKGGWINGETNGNLPPPEDQTPSHVVLPNGRLQRIDGQSMFQAGYSAPRPQGGVE